MSTQSGPGFVYVLTNPVMPGLCKIGLTAEPIENRLKQLYTTGVPAPFDCYFLAKVSDMRLVESALHKGLSKLRYSNSREFFLIEPAEAQALLSLAGEDVTPRNDLSAVVEPNTIRLQTSRSKLSFSSLGIPIGATLTFSKDERITATVATDNRILFNGKEMAVSPAALEALESLGYKWQAAQGVMYWMFDGRSLASIVDEQSDSE